MKETKNIISDGGKGRVRGQSDHMSFRFLGLQGPLWEDKGSSGA